MDNSKNNRESNNKTEIVTIKYGSVSVVGTAPLRIFLEVTIYKIILNTIA